MMDEGLSLPVRGAWVEIYLLHCADGYKLSLPVRGAWVEIVLKRIALAEVLVAPRAGSVG